MKVNITGNVKKIKQLQSSKLVKPTVYNNVIKQLKNNFNS